MWPLLLLHIALALGAQAKCLPSGNEEPINAALRIGGQGKTVTLCAGSVHRLQAPIVFTAPRQTLTTATLPTGEDASGHERAMLIVEGENQSTAIFADCKQCGDATISNLAIDGNRPQLLRVPLGGALIEIGNAEGQRVTGCRLYEPRGWSALHVREGDSLNCHKSYIADNVIGPCGEEWDEEYDGLVEKDPIWGNPRADGISVACKGSVIERNVVFDTTDGAIVIFGSAGTDVRFNNVYSRTRVVLGGVNLVDYDPYAGDYSQVSVHDNDFYAASGYFKVGIVVGPSSWSDDTDTRVRGGSVTDNHFHGERFGYAIVVSSAENFVVERNSLDEGARFVGVPGSTCPSAPENSPPMPFLIHRGSANGKYQEDFVNGEVQHRVICINPPDENGKPYKPRRLRDSPEAIKARDTARDEAQAMKEEGMDGAVADALVSYQGTLLAAMAELSAKWNASGELDKTPKAKEERRKALDRAESLQTRLAKLESHTSGLKAEFAYLDSDLADLAGKLARAAAVERPALEGVQAVLRRARSEKGAGWPSMPVGSGIWGFGAVLAVLAGMVAVRRLRRRKGLSLKSR